MDVTVVGTCEGKAAGEVVNVPVTVATDFATVVEASDGLSIGDVCGWQLRLHLPILAGGKPVVSVPEDSKRIQARQVSGALARTGADTQRECRNDCVVALCVVSPVSWHVVPKSLPTGKRLC